MKLIRAGVVVGMVCAAVVGCQPDRPLPAPSGGSAPSSVAAGTQRPTASATAGATSTGSASAESTGPGSTGTTAPPPSVPPRTETTAPSAGGNNSTKPPVPLESTAEVQPGVQVTVEQLEAVQGKAERIGEVAGPALRFRLRLVNNTAAAIDLSSTVVNLEYGKAKTPANPLTTGAVALPPAVANGAEATGVFVFVVPKNQRGAVRITVDYSVVDPVLVFSGAAPR